MKEEKKRPRRLVSVETENKFRRTLYCINPFNFWRTIHEHEQRITQLENKLDDARCEAELAENVGRLNEQMAELQIRLSANPGALIRSKLKNADFSKVKKFEL
jgi:hypothetical protein